MRLVFVTFVCWFVLEYFFLVIVYALAFVATLRFMLHMCIDCTCVLLSCVELFVWACMLVLRVTVLAFAIGCCKIALHITRACRLPACFAFVLLVCVLRLYTLFVRVIAYAFAIVCCKVAFHIPRACRLHVCV